VLYELLAGRDAPAGRPQTATPVPA
jgi:hypothetical protein